MTREGSTPQALDGLYASVLDSEPQLRIRIVALVEQMITAAEYEMAYGSPASRASLMKAAIPSMMRAIKSRTEEDGLKEIKAAYTNLLAEVRATRAADRDTPDDEPELDVPASVKKYLTDTGLGSHDRRED